MQRLFLLWARPLAPLLCVIVYGVVALFSSAHRASHLIELMVLSCLLAAGYRLAATRVSPDLVLRVALPIDTVLIGCLTLSTNRPTAVSLAYFWSIVLAASLLGALDTLLNTAVACVCAAAIPYLGDYHPDPLILVTVVLVLALIGSIMAGLASVAQRAERALERERDVDAAVLRVVERMRATLDPSDVLAETVAALGEECMALRALAVRVGGSGETKIWERDGGTPYLASSATSPASAILLRTGRPFATDLESADPDVQRYLRENGMTSLVGQPVFWQGRIVALVGIHADEPALWPGRSEEIVERTAEHFASALAQAEAHERAQRLTHMRDELIANVSHELRTPLTSTIGFLQTLERRDVQFDDATRHEYLTIARREAERLAVLVQDLLDLSTLERRGLRIDVQPVAVADVVREATATLRGEVDVDVPDSLLVRADAGRLLQILRNLISNGLRHGEGRVGVVGERSLDVVRIVITDDGAGVHSAHVAELFTPFAHWSGRNDSNGLGLAIARRIADAHGGSLVYRPADREAPHAFVLELPAV